MNEQELREMIRASIARHVGGTATSDHAHGGGEGSERPDYLMHAAFVRLPLSRGGDGDGACLIEPAVRCTHCGYCQSFGH